jgi:hypothetical protein
MQHQPSVDGIEQVERSILNVLVDDGEQRPWSLAEVEREFQDIGGRIDVQDALASLGRFGLIHRIDGFIMASRTAVHIHRIGMLGDV